MLRKKKKAKTSSCRTKDEKVAPSSVAAITSVAAMTSEVADKVLNAPETSTVAVVAAAVTGMAAT